MTLLIVRMLKMLSELLQLSVCPSPAEVMK